MHWIPPVPGGIPGFLNIMVVLTKSINLKRAIESLKLPFALSLSATLRRAPSSTLRRALSKGEG
jgi:hypothetical protein